MEHLEVKSGPMKAIRTGIAILNVIAGIAAFISSIGSDNIIIKIASAFIVVFGLYLMTGGFGLEKCWLRYDENGLVIKWTNRINPVIIHQSRIFKVSLERSRIIIARKEIKPVKLDISFFEKDQKALVYKFIMKFCQHYNILVEKHSSTML